MIFWTHEFHDGNSKPKDLHFTDPATDILHRDLNTIKYVVFFYSVVPLIKYNSG